MGIMISQDGGEGGPYAGSGVKKVQVDPIHPNIPEGSEKPP